MTSGSRGPRFVGVVPAAGRGTRLAPLRYPKELLPIAYEPVSGGGVRGRAVAEYAVEAIAGALAPPGTARVLFVVAPWKLDVVTYFGDGRHVGVQIGYLYQENAGGLPYALDLAYEWTRGQHVVFAMPDTVFQPRDALAQLREQYLRTGADLALALFPTDEPQRLGPVVTDGDQVRQVLDKVADPPVSNTWGAAIWSDAFADLMRAELSAHPAGAAEPVLGRYFDLAVHSGLRVTATHFPHGSFLDAGTHGGILRCLDTPPADVMRTPVTAGSVGSPL